MSLGYVLSAGGGSTKNIPPAFGPEGQLIVILGIVIGLIILSYIYSIAGVEYAEE
ncbi:MAG: hypothetical protein SXQ77_07685 [Halobacteria archaeon]|nr:hypothetical protein [Halobacteria archaeon]